MGTAAVGDQVVVVGDDVDLAAPGPVVDGVALAEGGHEVGRDRDAGCQAVKDVPLRAEVLAHRRVGEPLVVEGLARVADRRGGARRVDVLEARVPLAPEGGAPGLVDGVDRAVRRPQPAAEVGGAGVAVAGGDGDAVLVVHVPHGQRRVAAVALGEARGDGRRGRAVVRVAVADRATGAELVAHALGGDRQGVGMAAVEPDRRRHGRGAEVDADAVLVQQIDHPVEPAEVVLPRRGFEEGPGEDPDADHGDAGLPHQPDVVLPDGFRPLLGVVVPTEGEPGEALGGGRRHGSLPFYRSFGNVHTRHQQCEPNITAQQQPLTSVRDVSLL